jgi:hypothetical protein
MLSVDGMSDEGAPTTDKPDGKRRPRMRCAWLVVALLIVYPLSLGPSAFLAGTGTLGETAIDPIKPIYVPLVWIGEVCPQLGWLLAKYDTAPFDLGRCASDVVGRYGSFWSGPPR